MSETSTSPPSSDRRNIAAATTESRPRLLDLFCGAGGAAMGYHRAGFHITAIDIEPQPHCQADVIIEEGALAYLERLLWRQTKGDPIPFVAIHASPPCQAHTLMQSVAQNAAAHLDLIGPARELLQQTGLPYVIENVVGAPLDNSFILCGSMFGLEVDTHLGRFQLRRHRLFETNWPWLVPGKCRHQYRVIGLYGDHARSNRQHGEQSQFNAEDGLRYGRSVMEMPWSDWRGIAEAIPPAYTECIGSQLLDFLGKRDLNAARADAVYAPPDVGDDLVDGNGVVVGDFDVEMNEDRAGHGGLLSVDAPDSPKPASGVKGVAA